MPADASYLQTNFLGGEISKTRQGRMETEDYRTSLNVCRNALPVEEGGWNRRSGTAFCATTFRGQQGVLRTFYFNVANPYTIEMTPNVARVFDAGGLVLDSQNIVQTISSANPAVITTATANDWITGDEIVFFRLEADDTSYSPGFLMNRSFLITVTDDQDFTIVDPITGAGFDGSTVTLGAARIGCGRVLRLQTPYGQVGANDGVDGVRLVQGPDFALMCHGSIQPYLMATLSAPSDNLPATFAVQAASFQDGPYLDPPADGSTITPSGTSGSVTLTLGQAEYDSGTTYAEGDIVYFTGNRYTSLVDSNTGNEPDTSPTFWLLSVGISGVNQAQWYSTDIGRMVRLFNEPPEWASGTTYAAGANVTYAEVYWTSLVSSNTGNEPDLSPTDWEINPSGAVWTWAIITSITDNLNAVATIQGVPLLNTSAMETYQLGLYSDTTGWPTCGCYCEGRLYLAGSMPNRVDASMSNQPFVFSPTLTDGTVTDANGISAPFQSETDNTIYSMLSENQGVTIFTRGGEWLLSASQLSDPITPSSVQVHRISKFGSENVLAVRTPLAAIFVQRQGHKLIEYIADVYSGKYSGTNIGLKAKHLFDGGIVELAYQQEPVPIVWVRLEDNELIGVTYKRESPFGTQPASFVGWHRHDHGFGRIYESMQAGISPGGALDTLMVITNDPTTNVRWVETLMPLSDETTDITQVWNLDGSQNAAGAYISGNTLYMNGFYYLAGKTVDMWVAGVDGGSTTVAADGSLSVTINSAGSLLTETRLVDVSELGLSYTINGVNIPGTPTGIVNVPNLATITNFKITTPDTVIQDIASDTIWVDFDTQVAITAGHTPDGYRKHDMISGVEFQALSGVQWAKALPATDVESTNFPNQSADGLNGTVVDRQGKMMFAAGGTNFVAIRQANAASFLPAIRNHIGHEANLSGEIPAPDSMVTVPLGTQDYVVLTGPAGSQTIGWFNSTTMSDSTGLTTFPTDVRLSWNATLVKGRISTLEGGNTTEVFVLAGPTASAATVTYPVYLQAARLMLAGPDTGLTLAPALYPSTLETSAPGVNCIAYSQPIFDPLDNGIIFMVQMRKAEIWSSSLAYHASGADSDQVVGSDGNVYTCFVNNTNTDPVGDAGVHWTNIGSNSYTLKPFYLLKMNPLTGAIMWQTQITGISSIPGFIGGEQTRLTGAGVLAVLFGDGNLTAVNTATGALTILGAANGITDPQGQIYDDVTGQFVFYAAYSKDASLAPQPAGSTPNSFTTWAYFTGTTNDTFAGATPPDTFPAIVGASYTSQGQLIRPVAEQETGARNGPALAKTRRQHMYSFLLNNTQGLTVGTEFTGTMYNADLLGANQTPLPLTTLFSGVAWGTIDADYNFDNMFCWQVTRPYPATVLAAGGFLHTQDR